MSSLLGVLSVVGKGGNELFVFDDCLVRASTGIGALLLHGGRSPEAMLAAMTGQLQGYESKTPEQIAEEIPSNLLVRYENLASALLKKGRWPSTGLRRLVVTAPTGVTLCFDWPGDGATRPLNHDAYAVALLTGALGSLLSVQL